MIKIVTETPEERQRMPNLAGFLDYLRESQVLFDAIGRQGIISGLNYGVIIQC